MIPASKGPIAFDMLRYEALRPIFRPCSSGFDFSEIRVPIRPTGREFTSPIKQEKAAQTQKLFSETAPKKQTPRITKAVVRAVRVPIFSVIGLIKSWLIIPMTPKVAKTKDRV